MNKVKRNLLQLSPIRFLSAKSKQAIFPTTNLSWYEVTTYFLKQINKLGLNERASAISFNLIMALPAAILFLFSIIPYLPQSADLQTEVLGLFKDITPNSNTYIFIRNLLNSLMERQVGLFSFGFVLLIYYASNAMIGVIRTFDRSILEKKYFLHRRFRAIKLTLILIVLLLASATLLIGQDQFALLLKSLFHLKRKARLQWWNGVRWFILVGFLFYGIGLVYKFAPSVKKRWPLLSPGSFLATILTLLTTIILSYWVNHYARFDKVYGSIGTVLVIMLLIRFNALILLIGFELNVTIMYLTAQKEKQTVEIEQR
ncbi:YihY/virulence factor BrkB family protein [Parasediminibacterium paludis]|uniref:YihY/virulence factor BrkB family protein n=1 Tax=Parasediminibacterium paludis TaxID=908966 RepID=A0ABV8PXE1_9BACT